MSAQPENASWPSSAAFALPPRDVLLIAEKGSLENIPEGVEVIWLTPGKPMPLVVQR